MRTRRPNLLEQARRRRDERLRRAADAPEPLATQDEQRRNRRRHITVRYDGRFDLTAEIRAVLDPIAGRSDTSRYPHVVRDLAAAVHQTRLDLEQLLVERQARRRIADLPYEKRGRAKDLIVASWERPAAPVIDPTSGWAETLLVHIAPLTADLSDYLGRATPPGQTRGGVSVSERVEQILRELDRAVTSATRNLDNYAANQATASTLLNPKLRQLGATPDELAEFGIT